MQAHNLETSIAALKNLRDTYQCQLDIRAVTELNAVITELEVVSRQEGTERRKAACVRAFQVFADVLRLIFTFRDLM